MRTLASTAILLVLATSVAVAQSPPPVPPSQTVPQTAPQTSPQTPPQTMPRAAPAEIPAAQPLASIPDNAATITHWYKQPIYDQADNRIGEIDDVLVDREAKIVALIIGVGGFLGMGEKHVAVPYNAVRVTTKNNNKWYLVMNSNKDALKNAPGFKYDRTSAVWMPEGAPATTGTSAPRTR